MFSYCVRLYVGSVYVFFRRGASNSCNQKLLNTNCFDSDESTVLFEHDSTLSVVGALFISYEFSISLHNCEFRFTTLSNHFEYEKTLLNNVLGAIDTESVFYHIIFEVYSHMKITRVNVFMWTFDSGIKINICFVR